MIRQGRVQSFVYDGAGRLKQETDTSGTNKVYGYDPRGNRTSMTVTGAEAYTTAYTYDLNNRLTREARSDTAGMSVTNYNYDPNGNLISKGYETYSTAGEDAESLALDISGAYIDSYVYNVRNQLVSAQTGGTVSAYSYNAAGMRNAKTVDGETTYQVWSNGNVISEYGAHTAVYRYGNGLVDATEGGVQRYYLYNGHGDTTQLVNSQGSVIADYQYDAFGNQTGGENADVYNPFRYNGQYTDEETGLIYLRNRYYDPATGRFMTEDPVKDGLNWYVYCGGNPVMFVDPLGLWMAGDEKLTQGAQTYTIYYGQQWEAAKAKYDASVAAGDISGAEAAQKEMDNLHAKAEDIRAQDAAGQVEGKTLDVPVYNQLDVPNGNGTNLCWASSAAMVISYYLGDTVDRTVLIAVMYAIMDPPNNQTKGQYDPADPASYNLPQAWFSTERTGLVSQYQDQDLGMLTMSEIESQINGGDPFGVLYRNSSSGHWIVGVGYASAAGHDSLVVSNDPWGGVQRTQTYDDFQTYEDGRKWMWTAR